VRRRHEHAGAEQAVAALHAYLRTTRSTTRGSASCSVPRLAECPDRGARCAPAGSACARHESSATATAKTPTQPKTRSLRLQVVAARPRASPASLPFRQCAPVGAAHGRGWSEPRGDPRAGTPAGSYRLCVRRLRFAPLCGRLWGATHELHITPARAQRRAPTCRSPDLALRLALPLGAASAAAAAAAFCAVPAQPHKQPPAASER
jgi:hypothetical protein